MGVLGAQPERMVWVMMRKMVDDGEVAKMHGFLRKHGVKKSSEEKAATRGDNQQ